MLIQFLSTPEWCYPSNGGLPVWWYMLSGSSHTDHTWCPCERPTKCIPTL